MPTLVHARVRRDEDVDGQQCECGERRADSAGREAAAQQAHAQLAVAGEAERGDDADQDRGEGADDEVEGADAELEVRDSVRADCLTLAALQCALHALVDAPPRANVQASLQDEEHRLLHRQDQRLQQVGLRHHQPVLRLRSRHGRAGAEGECAAHALERALPRDIAPRECACPNQQRVGGLDSLWLVREKRAHKGHGGVREGEPGDRLSLTRKILAGP
mmetsp:Transcript_4610/g.14897  ORF Transcript_4610/g.14897 Transcript_4610/m.14897 type:complete len:219 (-) Transcript_4610:604-1260(-)